MKVTTHCSGLNTNNMDFANNNYKIYILKCFRVSYKELSFTLPKKGGVIRRKELHAQGKSGLFHSKDAIVVIIIHI